MCMKRNLNNHSLKDERKICETDHVLMDPFEEEFQAQCTLTSNVGTKCILCGSDDLTETNESLICNDCGCILTRFIDCKTECKNIYKNEDPGQGQNFSSSNGLAEGRTPGFRNKDTRCYKDNRRMLKQANWGNSSHTDRSLNTMRNDLDQYGSRARIPPNAIEKAKSICADLIMKKTLTGDKREKLYAAGLYMGCIHENVCRPKKEIAQLFNVDIREMHKAVSKFEEHYGTPTPSINAEQFMVRMGIKLEMTDEQITEARELGKKVRSCHNGHRPQTFALGCLGNVMKLPPERLATTFEMCNTTVKQIMQEISQEVNKLKETGSSSSSNSTSSVKQHNVK